MIVINSNMFEENEAEEKRKSSKFISLVFGVVPLLLIIGFFLLFAFDDDIKQRVVGIFINMNELNVNISFYLIIYGMLLVILNIPYVIFEMGLGFTFSFPIALFFAVTAKFIGEMFCFMLSRYVMKSTCLQFLRRYEKFIILEKAVKKYPWLVSNLIRASIILPLFVVNFGSGIIDLSFAQFILPALFWGTIFSAIAVFCGSQLLNIKEILENEVVPKNNTLFIFELVMIILTITMMAFIFWKSSKIYQDIKAEIKDEMMNEKQLQSKVTVDRISKDKSPTVESV